MAKQFMLMEPKNENFNELIGGSGKYIVPRFQRDYAWDIEQWEDLWSDITTLGDEGFHYMGYIVLQQKEQYQYEVIDGQQRLVTLSIIVLAAMKAIKDMIARGEDEEENRERLDEITKKFVGNKNLVSLKVTSKLELNRNNNKYFQRICSDLEAPNNRGMTATNKLIKKCFSYFCKKEFGPTGADVAQFIVSFSSSMVFTKIIVQDDLNAYKVFETLNARGVQLSTPDLLKNYLFSIVTKNENIDDDELNDLDEQWSEIISELGESNVSDYVRYHHNSQRKMMTKNDLFSAMRKVVQKPEEAYEYLMKDGGGNFQNKSAGSQNNGFNKNMNPEFAEVRRMIDMGNINGAETTLNRIRNRNDAEKVAGHVNTLRKRRNAEPLIEDEIKALLMNY